MKHSVIYTNRQLLEVLNLPENTLEFEMHCKPGKLPVLKVTTMVGVDQEKLKTITETNEFKLELVPKQENGLG